MLRARYYATWKHSQSFALWRMNQRHYAACGARTGPGTTPSAKRQVCILTATGPTVGSSWAFAQSDSGRTCPSGSAGVRPSGTRTVGCSAEQRAVHGPTISTTMRVAAKRKLVQHAKVRLPAHRTSLCFQQCSNRNIAVRLLLITLMRFCLCQGGQQTQVLGVLSA